MSTKERMQNDLWFARAFGNKPYQKDGRILVRTDDEIKGKTFSPDQKLIKKNATEYIKLRNGTNAVVRTWDGSKNKYKYTAIGKNTLRENHQNTLWNFLN